MEKELVDPTESNIIRFGVATEYDNGEETRTEYSGKDQNNALISSSSQYERINWLNTDKIHIRCAETIDLDRMDYTVTPNTDKSTAAVSPVTAGAQFRWNNAIADHYFFAVYPAPASTNGISIDTPSGGTTKVHGTIPADQSTGVTLSGRAYKPNMNYAYMYAAKKQRNDNPPTTTNVTLEFKPLVTAFQFSIIADDVFTITDKLTKAELISSSTNLAGSFEATLNGNGLSGDPTVSSGTKTLSITFPNGGIQLSTTDATSFTFLALPVQQTGLTLKLYFGSSSRSIALKVGDADMSVAARKKIYINNIDVPGKADFTFVVGNPAVDAIISSDGGYEDWTVTSYSLYNGTKKAEPWKAVEYYTSTDGGMTWSPSKNNGQWVRPSWFPNIPDDSGSITAKSYRSTLGANTAVTQKQWTGNKSDATNSSKTSAIDLSKVNFLTGQTINETTANCYVVTGPGWYKFPLIYGNARKNGIDNTGAYSNSNSQSNVLKTFVRHDGKAITDPKITQNVTVGGALLCWQDIDPNRDIIDSVEKDGEYIYFRVSKDYIKQGNAVIAATSGSNGTGDIVWSWHIWIVERERLTTIPMQNSHNVLNVNLGWYDANQTVLQRAVKVVLEQTVSKKRQELIIKQDAADVFGGCVFYQWGRKDPIVGFDENYTKKQTRGPKGYGTHTIDYHDESYKAHHGLIDYTRHRTIIDTPIEYSIKNPNLFITLPTTEVPNGHRDAVFAPQINTPLCQVAGGQWYNARYDNLWNANAVFGSDNEVVKTVYDPSPAGFKVPRYNTFNNLGTRVKSLGFGFLFQTKSGIDERMLFPVTSLREYPDGNLRSKSHPDAKNVYIWTAGKNTYYNPDDAGVQSQSVGTYLQMKTDGSYNGHTRMSLDAYGFCVRPEVE